MNEPGKLIIKISGAGNLQLLNAPSLNWPEGIDAFEPSATESLSKVTVPVSGHKIFEYNFSVATAGNYILPAVNFSYFDPQTASYKTIQTKEFSFTVIKPARRQTTPESITRHDLPASGINEIFNNRWWIILFIAMMATAGIVFWLKREKRIHADNKEVLSNDENTKLDGLIETATSNQQNPLSKTAECLYLDDCSGFYTLLNIELKNYLSKKLFIATPEINIKNIAAVMDKNNMSNDMVLALQQLLQEIELQLYTPFERNDKMKGLYDEAHNIIQLINAQEIKHL